MALRVVGVTLRAVGVASRTESLVHVVTSYTGWLLLLILVWRVWLFLLNPIFQFPRGHMGMERSFPKLAKWLSSCLMGFKLKRMNTSMRADPAFVSSIAS